MGWMEMLLPWSESISSTQILWKLSTSYQLLFPKSVTTLTLNLLKWIPSSMLAWVFICQKNRYRSVLPLSCVIVLQAGLSSGGLQELASVSVLMPFSTQLPGACSWWSLYRIPSHVCCEDCLKIATGSGPREIECTSYVRYLSPPHFLLQTSQSVWPLLLLKSSHALLRKIEDVWCFGIFI